LLLFSSFVKNLLSIDLNSSVMVGSTELVSSFLRLVARPLTARHPRMHLPS